MLTIVLLKVSTVLLKIFIRYSKALLPSGNTLQMYVASEEFILTCPSNYRLASIVSHFCVSTGFNRLRSYLHHAHNMFKSPISTCHGQSQVTRLPSQPRSVVCAVLHCCPFVDLLDFVFSLGASFSLNSNRVVFET
jgi:hypothetical protein